jgi:hypothetical protein
MNTKGLSYQKYDLFLAYFIGWLIGFASMLSIVIIGELLK